MHDIFETTNKVQMNEGTDGRAIAFHLFGPEAPEADDTVVETIQIDWNGNLNDFAKSLRAAAAEAERLDREHKGMTFEMSIEEM